MQKLKSVSDKSHKIFFARKFEAFVDQNPVNELEESIGGLNRSTKGWDSYWLNSYNTLDQGCAVIGQFAQAVVSHFLATHSECGDDMAAEVIEVTSLVVSGKHEGEIIQFRYLGDTYEVLVMPDQGLVLMQGLFKGILNIRVGEGWDDREKVFRNMIGAFSTSSQLFLLVKLTPGKKLYKVHQLEYDFYDPNGEKQGHSKSDISRNKREVLVDMAQLGLNLVPGVWGVQVSSDGKAVAKLQFLVISQHSPISNISSFYSPISLCSVVPLSPSSRCLPGAVSCHTTEWSSTVEDRKSVFP